MNDSNSIVITSQLPENKGEIILYQPDDSIKLEVIIEDETVWLTQLQMAELFQTTVANVNIHLKNIYDDNELEELATIKDFLIVRKEGKRKVQRTIFYIDETVLLLLSKRENGVDASIYTSQISPQLQLDLQRHNAQYPPISITVFNRSHDRFLIIDNTIYHFGASLKDLGKKWFAFSKMKIDMGELMKIIV